MNRRIIANLGIVVITALPFIRHVVNSSLVLQTIIYMPLIIITGILAVKFLPERTYKYIHSADPHGVVLLLLAVFTFIYWLLPRNIDYAVYDDSIYLVRHLTLYIVIGMPLGFSLVRLPCWLLHLTWSMGVAMLFTMGWLYNVAPSRLCNYFLIDEQKYLGTILVVLGVILLCLKLIYFFMESDSNDHTVTKLRSHHLRSPVEE